MSSFSDYTENAVLNHLFRNVALPAPATTAMALYTVAPTDAGGGTQVSGNGYARAEVIFGAPTNGVISNSEAVSFTASGGSFGTVVAIGIFDQPAAGNLLAWAPITPREISDGDTLNFPVGEIDVTLT